MSRAPVADVWYVGVDQVPGQLAALLDDRDRARRRQILPDPDRDRFLAAWVLARLVLGARLGRDPAALSFDRTCAQCGDQRHGKPTVKGVDFSLSHAGGLAVVAVSKQAVGVDVEDATAGEHPQATALTNRERETCSTYASFAQLWTRKEAVLKATGKGLAIHPVCVEVLGSTLVALPEELGDPQDYTLCDLALPAPYVGSLAVLGPELTFSVHNGAALIKAVAATDDLLDRPAETVRAYCSAMDIPFLPDALSWQPGMRPAPTGCKTPAPLRRTSRACDPRRFDHRDLVRGG